MLETTEGQNNTWCLLLNQKTVREMQVFMSPTNPGNFSTFKKKRPNRERL